MNAKKLAALLHGSEYGALSKAPDIIKQARHAGLVIVYGQSDDLIEFDGAMCDEYGACNGQVYEIDRDGVIPPFDEVKDRGINALRNWFQREGEGREIEAFWNKDGYSWIYQTDIPHECFDIMEDDNTYCRGIVFSLDDLCASPISDHEVLDDKGWKPTHRHVLRGTEYMEAGEATLQTDVPLHDHAPLVLYQDKTGRIYARTPMEFEDGRFVCLSLDSVASDNDSA